MNLKSFLGALIIGLVPICAFPAVNASSGIVAYFIQKSSANSGLTVVGKDYAGLKRIGKSAKNKTKKNVDIRKHKDKIDIRKKNDSKTDKAA